jgi:hypothetical protein
VLLAALCLSLGLVAMFGNRVSYTNNFSTILRVTRDSAFSALMEDDEDANGADPLPKHVADVMVTFVDQGDNVAAGDSVAGMRVLR